MHTVPNAARRAQSAENAASRYGRCRLSVHQRQHARRRVGLYYGQCESKPERFSRRNPKQSFRSASEGNRVLLPPPTRRCILGSEASLSNKLRAGRGSSSKRTMSPSPKPSRTSRFLTSQRCVRAARCCALSLFRALVPRSAKLTAVHRSVQTGWPTASMTPENATLGGAVAGVSELQTFLDTYPCQANANESCESSLSSVLAAPLS